VATLEEAGGGEAGAGARGAEGGRAGVLADIVRDVRHATTTASAPAATPGTLPSGPPASAHFATLQISAAADERALRPRHVVCLAGEVDEDALVDKLGLSGLAWLREKGLLTYPSPLLGRLLEELPAVLAAEVLSRLVPADNAVLAQVARPWLEVVLTFGLPRAGKTAGVPLKLSEFVGSAERLAWAKANGCAWEARTCAPLPGADTWRR
jgi:hypothetical protein